MKINLHVFDIWSEDHPTVKLSNTTHRYKILPTHIEGLSMVQVDTTNNPPVGRSYRFQLNGKETSVNLYKRECNLLTKSTRNEGFPVIPTNDFYNRSDRVVSFKNSKDVSYSVISTGDRIVLNRHTNPRTVVITSIDKITDLSYTKPFANVTIAQRDAWLKKHFTHVLSFKEVITIEQSTEAPSAS